MEQQDPACPIRPPAQDGLPRGSQSGHRSRSNNLLRSSPLGSAAWTSCPVLDSWVEWTHDGHIAQAWMGPQAEGAERGYCSPEGEKREPGVNSGSKALPSEILPLLPSWSLRSASVIQMATPEGWVVPSSFLAVTLMAEGPCNSGAKQIWVEPRSISC